MCCVIKHCTFHSNNFLLTLSESMKSCITFVLLFIAETITNSENEIVKTMDPVFKHETKCLFSSMLQKYVGVNVP